MKIFGEFFRTSFLFIFLTELLSLFGYLLPDFNTACFFVISFLVLALTITKLEYGLAIMFAELFIGSKGYLFSFSFAGTPISIRMAIWVIIMSVWLGKIILSFLGKYHYSLKPVFQNDFFKYFLVLFVAISWGLLNGYLSHNSFGNLFLDFNGWLYFAILFPVYTVVMNRRADEENLSSMVMQIFAATTIWLGIETLVLLYFFSHNLLAVSEGLYRWIRVTGAGEITRMEAGFYRIFFQSHIYSMVAFFVFSLLMIKKYFEKKKKETLILFFAATLFTATNLISLSRSNWVGLAVGIILCALVIFYLYGWKKTFVAAIIVLSTVIYAVGLTALVVKFPYPNANSNLDISSVFTDRAQQISGEAGASSRWSLLPELWQKISERPMLGQGFGATVTYKTSDPRILESNPDGLYSTYAFEWGWLDIWLKISVFGIIAYLALILAIVLKSTAESDNIYSSRKISEIGLSIGLIAIAAVSFFSPYLNHPLGISFLILVSAITLNNTQRAELKYPLQKK